MAKRKKKERVLEISNKVSVLNQLDFDAIVDDIADGKTFREIAEENQTPLSNLYRFIHSTAERSARVRIAQKISADSFADMAEDVLKKARDFMELGKARELAQHYRWKASKRDPQRYGDKVDITTGGEKIPNTVIQWGDKKIAV